MTTETKGYTLAGIVGRIRDLENKTNGGYYLALCWLAMNRNSGKNAKKALEVKVFGQDKPTSTFRNAWRIAEKAFSEGFHKAHRVKVDGMTLDDAVKFALECFEAHKLALKATNMADYEERCKYAAFSEVPAIAPAEVEAVGKPAADTESAAAEEPKNDMGEPAANDVVEFAVAAMLALNTDELVAFAARVQARLTELEDSQHMRLAA